ncbi:hypothetical protein Acsp07_26980 [Actinomycetospora sp. NBRC 106378]|nr:hypothetical protein Acsp07_26980 [Actinomycetospora sp. NBRC 106378]
MPSSSEMGDDLQDRVRDPVDLGQEGLGHDRDAHGMDGCRREVRVSDDDVTSRRTLSQQLGAAAL